MAPALSILVRIEFGLIEILVEAQRARGAINLERSRPSMAASSYVPEKKERFFDASLGLVQSGSVHDVIELEDRLSPSLPGSPIDSDLIFLSPEGSAAVTLIAQYVE
jgi:hypothetical protein